MCPLKIDTVFARLPSKGQNGTVPLSVTRDLDTRGWMTDVATFVFHMHLPHYAVTTDDPRAILVLARQPIDMSKPHPFIEAGNSEFNMFLWMPPSAIVRGTSCSQTPPSLRHCSAVMRFA